MNIERPRVYAALFLAWNAAALVVGLSLAQTIALIGAI